MPPESHEQFAQAYPPGTAVSGTISLTPQYGIFVQLDDFPADVVALLEIIWVPNLDYSRYPENFPLGSRIEARILGWREGFRQVYLTQLD